MSDVLAKPEVNTARWKVKLYYRSEDFELLDVGNYILDFLFLIG